jgi:hypothetical protein
MTWFTNMTGAINRDEKKSHCKFHNEFTCKGICCAKKFFQYIKSEQY